MEKREETERQGLQAAGTVALLTASAPDRKEERKKGKERKSRATIKALTQSAHFAWARASLLPQPTFIARGTPFFLPLKGKEITKFLSRMVGAHIA